jgi:MGT family glycosyltransferase
VAKTVFFNIPAQGHINPTIAVVAELVRRGERVIYVNTEASRAQIAPTSAQFLPYPALPELDALIKNFSGNFPRNALTLTQIGERLLPFVLDLLRREHPDYVIYDSLCSWARQAAQLLHIPAVASICTFVLGRGALPPTPLSSLALMISQFIPVLPEYWRTARRVRRTFGVEPVGLLGALMNTADLNIVYTSAEFQPAAANFGETFKFVGPSMDGRPAEVDFPFDQLTRRPVVYISLGTIITNVEFYRRCFAAFGDHPGQFVVSVGKQTDIASLGKIPANFIVRNFVPQLEVLQRSDALITHGGLNSVHEGLYYGVPLLVVPQHMEQAFVAQQVIQHDAGLVLGDRPPFGQVSASQLRATLERLLSERERYQQAAAKLGDSLRAAGGPQRAVDEILAFRKPREM